MESWDISVTAISQLLTLNSQLYLKISHKLLTKEKEWGIIELIKKKARSSDRFLLSTWVKDRRFWKGWAVFFYLPYLRLFLTVKIREITSSNTLMNITILSYVNIVTYLLPRVLSDKVRGKGSVRYVTIFSSSGKKEPAAVPSYPAYVPSDRNYSILVGKCQ